MQVSFVIDDGPKAKVKEDRLRRQQRLHRCGKLRGKMKKIKQSGFFN
jgi:hypothetical protein